MVPAEVGGRNGNNKTIKMTDFRKFLINHYGSIVNCSKELGVTRQTISNWQMINPRGILKFAPEIIRSKDVTWMQLSGEVLHHEEQLKK